MVEKLRGRITYAIDGKPSEVLGAVQDAIARGAGIVIVDYVQAAQFPRADRHDLEVAGLARAVKGLCARAGIPAVVCSQITTDRQRPFAEPTPYDLKESRILMDAAEVITLQWESSGAPGAPVLGRVAKCKWGPKGKPYTLSISEQHGVITGAEEGHPPAQLENGQGQQRRTLAFQQSSRRDFED